jgi:hypothetical protein
MTGTGDYRMRIDAVPNPTQLRPPHPANENAAAHAKPAGAQPQPAAEPPPPPPPLAADGNEAANDDSRGAIRLLQEAHFKGVADVRLRINFFDELAGDAESQALSSLPEGTESLVSTVISQFEGIAETLAPDAATASATSETVDAFKTSVYAAADEAVASGELDRDALEAALRDAFGTFIEKLREQFTPPDEAPAETPPEQPPATPEEPPAEGSAVEPSAEEPADAEPEQADAGGEGTDAVDPFASLVEVFEQSLTTLLDSLATAVRLPDPSPPSGNGVAYDKFLAIYNALRDGGTPATDAENPDAAGGDPDGEGDVPSIETFA